MTMTETQRAAKLAARFNASKARTEQSERAEADERRLVVRELLTFMKAHEIAELLNISVTRVYQIVGGVRK